MKIIYLTAFFLSIYFNASLFSEELNKCSEEFNGQKIIEISLNDLFKTKSYVVKRELENAIGEDFQCSKWEREKIKLNNLDVFAEILLEVEKVDGGLLLRYNFKEIPEYIIFPAVKKTDQTGLMIGPAIVFFNLLGRDIRLEGFLRSSVYPELVQSTELLIESSALWIGNLPLEYNLVMSASKSYNSLKEFNEESINTKIDFFQRISRELKIIYAVEEFYVRLDNETDYFSPGLQQEEHILFLSSRGGDFIPKIGTGIILDLRDTIYHTHNGLYQELRYSKYGGILGGPADYNEWLFDTRAYWMPIDDHIFFISMLGQYRPGKMGAYDFFHIGGSNSLRTYNPEPEFFGQHEFLGTFEYRLEFFNHQSLSFLGFDVYYGLQLVIGFDYDRLWLNDENIFGGKTYTGYFTGLHLLIPGIERVRLELGVHDVDLKDVDFTFGFNFGLFSKTNVQRGRIR